MIRSQGLEVSIKDLDGLISLLTDKKKKKEQEEAETNMHIMLSFLHCLRKQKLEQLNQVLIEFVSMSMSWSCLVFSCPLLVYQFNVLHGAFHLLTGHRAGLND